MALLASCSSELMETTGVATKGNVEKVSIQSHPFEFEDGTRTSLSATEKAISFAWANTDALGVFPISPTTNSQARQDISVPTDCGPHDAHYASFDGAGWGLKDGNTYAAYVPYNGTLPSETPYTAVPIDMTGQDGTLANIGLKYDYMCAPSTTNEEQCASAGTHELVFDFQHVISVIQFKLTMPVAATWKSLTLANDAGDKVWKTSATMNVGAQSETDYGDYFAWGEITPQSSNTYTWSSYKWCNGGSNSLTKFCVNSSYGTVDDKTTLDPEDDAASVNWGGTWRMPTREEQEELLNKCTWQWVTSYNNVSVNGYIVTGNNGNSIFLPVAGAYYNGSFQDGWGRYHSSSIYERINFFASSLSFDSSNRSVGAWYRNYGLPVRAVCK